MTLEASFVRHRQRRDRIYVRRQDGTSTFWDFPTYGDGLPHDLVHLVVEDTLGIEDGFWGLVDRGVEVRLVDNQATLVLDGQALAGPPDFDVSGLTRAEKAVALMMSRSAAPGDTAGAIDETMSRLKKLGPRWRDLPDGEAIILTYTGGRSDEPVREGPAS